jgi:hypothetical protein
MEYFQDGFPIATGAGDPGTTGTYTMISTDPSIAKARIAELQANKAFQDSLLDVRDPQHAIRMNTWRGLHVVASRGGR